MAFFGIPGTDAASGGAFLARIQFDARVGFWKIIHRVAQPDGSYEDEPTEPFRNPAFLIDFGTLEVGYINFTSPPAFLVVPYGHAIPPRPGDKKLNDDGKERNAFIPGFRLKTYNPKMYGNADAYYFSANSKTVLEPMHELHTLILQAPEYKSGKVPLIRVTGSASVKNTTPKGTNTYYAPVFSIAGWHDRPECFGPRTVALPNGAAPGALTAASHAPPSNGAAKAAPAPVGRSGPPAGHSAAGGDKWGSAPQAASQPVQVGSAEDPLNDVIPF